MYLDYDEFDKITAESRKVFSTWEEQFEAFREVLRDLAKKRNQEKLPLRVLLIFVIILIYFRSLLNIGHFKNELPASESLEDNTTNLKW